MAAYTSTIKPAATSEAAKTSQGSTYPGSYKAWDINDNELRTQGNKVPVNANAGNQTANNTSGLAAANSPSWELGAQRTAVNNPVANSTDETYFYGGMPLFFQESPAPAATPAAPAAPAATNKIKTKPVTDYLNDYNTERENKIRNMYSGNLASQNAGLKSALDANLGALRTAYDENLNNLRTAYDNNAGSLKTAYDKNIAQIRDSYQQNLSDAEAARAQISPQYQESMNALSADYERQRRNNNMQAALSGLNSGAGSQMALGQSMAYQRNQGNLARSENEALNEAQRGITDLSRSYRNQQDILNTELANNIDKLNREYQNNLNTYSTTFQNNLASMKTNYENQIAQAAANNDYQLAAALLDDYGNQYDRMQNQAALLAQFGDFSAYADMYGKEAADNMRLTWALQNPEVAWASGNLKAEDYYALTGRQPFNPNNLYGLAMFDMASPMFGSPYGSQATGYYKGVTQPENDLYSAYRSNFGGY